MKVDKVIIILFVLFSVLHQIIGEKDVLLFLRLAQITGMVALVKVLFELNMRDILKKTTLYIVIICVISTFLVGVANNRMYILNLNYALCFFAISGLIVKTKPSVTFFIIISFVVYSYLLYSFLTGVPPEDWVKGSRNYVSVILIYLTVIIASIDYLNNRTPKILIHFVLPLLCLLFCVLALSRSGIISSLLLSVASTLYFFKNKKTKTSFKWFVLIALIGVINFILGKFEFINSSYLYKFETKELDLAERRDIINIYLDDIDRVSFFFGPSNINKIYQGQNLTLHNSFLHWHFSYGIGALVIFLLVLTSVVMLLRLNAYFGVLFIIIFIRSFTDQLLLSDGILLGLPMFLILVMNDAYVFDEK